jgi:hypothetical protein
MCQEEMDLKTTARLKCRRVRRGHWERTIVARISVRDDRTVVRRDTNSAQAQQVWRILTEEGVVLGRACWVVEESNTLGKVYKAGKGWRVRAARWRDAHEWLRRHNMLVQKGCNRKNMGCSWWEMRK